MGNTVELPRISADDFARRFSMRAGNLMWLLGAGASASAGIPTAWDMIWEFKQQLFVSQRRASLQSVSDLSNPAVRAQLQEHVDSSKKAPLADSPEEYAELFEAVYPSEADRRAYLDAKMAGARPSYGHLALATLMRAQLARLIWTTNFDPLIADACAKVYESTGNLTTVDLDAPDQARQLTNEQRWPIEVKLHGDFRSRRLKNTNDELRHQDVRLRQLLVDSCRRFGLVIAGYSGRDVSIMDALEHALDQSAFPAGLFWLHRGDGSPLPRVVQLLKKAAEEKVEVALVSIENFDESLRDLVRLVNLTDSKVLDAFAAERQRWTSALRPSGGRGWPVVRLNALPIVHWPSTCRRIVCQIGGMVDVREAVERAGVNVIVARTKAGVLAYGADSDVRAAFQGFGITDFSLHTIDAKRLRYDSGERGLLRDALARAVGRQRSLEVIRRRSSDLLAPANPQDKAWVALQDLVGSLWGTVKNHPELRWREGLSVRIDWADDRLWLLIEPRTVFDGISEHSKALAADFARERAAKRYNRQLNDLLAFWANYLADNGSELRAMNIGDGVEAVFRLSAKNGFSRRAQP